MKTSLSVALLALALGTNAVASSKICFGSTKDETTKGVVMTAEINESEISFKTIKGDYDYTGTYPTRNSTVNGRDGKTYLNYEGRDGEYQDIVMVDSTLLEAGTTGLIQIRARGEGFFNFAFVCKDAQ